MEYIDIRKSYTKENLIKIANVIKSGGTVTLPTDTIYGISSDATNKQAVRKVYELKNRDFSHSMNVLASNVTMIEKVTKDMSLLERSIVEKAFPNPFTIILKKNNNIPNIVTGGLDTVGIRIPKDDFLLKLIELIERPIVSTSCNLVGKPIITNCKDAIETFGDNVDMIVDRGETKESIPSTIIKIENEKINILRQGAMKLEELMNKIK